MRKTLSLVALAASLLATTPAHAAHVMSGWYAWAYSNARHYQAPGVEAWVWIVSGTIQSSQSANGGSFAAGPLTPGATSAWAMANAPLGGELTNVTTSADLATGTAKATAIIIDGGFPSMQGAGQGRFRETLWFTNTTETWLPISYRVEVDGAVSGFPVELGGEANWSAHARTFVPESQACTLAGACIGFAADGSVPAASMFRAEYTKLTGLGFHDPMSQAAFWTVTANPGHDVPAGLFNFTMSTTLWVPPGETTLVIEPELQLSSCGGQSGTCGFGNSGRARLGLAPQGLSWTSQSGVFLSDLAPPGGTIPEPGTWALLIAGFGMIGSTLRNRRNLART
jgi:hypothetical protein